MKESDNTYQLHKGKVVAIRSSVIDISFEGKLPCLYTQLRTGENGEIIIEVASHLNSQTVRGIALTPITGLARGATVINTTQPLQVPVGKRTLGRVFNVFGQTIDGKEEITGGEWRSIHQASLALKQRANTSEILETGIKVIDVLAPLERGEGWTIWRCRRRQDGFNYGNDSQHGESA